MNERIRRSSKNKFVCSFFGRIHGYQKSFRNYLTFNQCDFQLLKLPDISGGEYCKITLNTNKQALLTNLSRSELGQTQIN